MKKTLARYANAYKYYYCYCFLLLLLLLLFLFQIFKLRELLNLCSGGSAAHPIIRETVQKLAIASTVQVR